jgi:hypothetical protein
MYTLHVCIVCAGVYDLCVCLCVHVCCTSLLNVSRARVVVEWGAEKRLSG